MGNMILATQSAVITSAHDALLTDLEQCREREKKLHARYVHAVNAGYSKKADTTAHAYITSADVGFVALVESTNSLPPSIRANLQECKELAPALKLYAPITESVKVFAIPESNGGFRAVCSFAPLHRAAQCIVRRLLMPHVHPRPWEYDFKEIHKAANEIIAVLKKRPTMFAWRGKISAVRIGRRLLVPRAALDELPNGAVMRSYLYLLLHHTASH